MSDDTNIKKLQEELEVLRQKVRDRKDEILQSIDIDKMMINPKEYLNRLSKEFYRSNQKSFQQAIKSGKKLAGKMLKGHSNVKD